MRGDGPQKPYSDKIKMEAQRNFGHGMNALETGIGIKTPVLNSLLDISIKPYTELNPEQELERYEVIINSYFNEDGTCKNEMFFNPDGSPRNENLDYLGEIDWSINLFTDRICRDNQLFDKYESDLTILNTKRFKLNEFIHSKC